MFRFAKTMAAVAAAVCLSLPAAAGFDGQKVGGSLWGVAQGSAFAVAVGPGGQVAVTEEGGPWRSRKIKGGGLLLAADIAGHTTIYAVGGQGGFTAGRAVILRSRDRGKTFQRLKGIPGKTLYEVKFVAPDVGFAAGVGGTLLRTSDRGETWSAVPTGTQAHLWAMHFNDDGQGLIGGGHTPWQNDNKSSGIIRRTSDGGATWETVHTGKKRVSDFAFIDDRVGFAALVGGRLLKTSDGGRTWTDGGKTPLGAIINAVAFSSASCGVVVGSGGTAYATTDGGRTWPHKITVTKGSFLEDLDATANGGHWVAGGDGTLGRLRPEC